MLLEVYNNLKALLSAISSVKLIAWFNDQYSGTIHTTPALFVEFPNALNWQTLSGSNQQAEFTVRVHTVTKAVANQAGEIQEGALMQHENINSAVFSTLHQLSFLQSDFIQHNALNRVQLQHHQYMQGWLVTTQDFEAMIYHRHEADTQPAPNIIFDVTTS